MTDPPSNGTNGRDYGGRFARGNAGGPGNPHAAKVSKLRTALLSAVTEDDIRQVVEMLLRLAKTGDLAAVRELFQRTLGKPIEPDLLERIERLEQSLESSGVSWD